MTGLDVAGVLAGVAVRDLDAAADWYQQLLGREPDARPMPPLMDWYFGEHTLQVFHDPERAGGSMITLVVEDLVAAQQDLASRGIRVEVDDTTSDKVKFGQLTDPDGNSVSLVETR